MVLHNKISKKDITPNVSGEPETCASQLSNSLWLSEETTKTNVFSLLTPDQLVNIYEELQNILNKIETDGIIIKTNEFTKVNFMFQDLYTNCENTAQLLEIEKLADRLLQSQKDSSLYPIIELKIHNYKDMQNTMNIHNIQKKNNKTNKTNNKNSQIQKQTSEKMDVEKIENHKRQRKSPPPQDDFIKPKKSCFLSKYVKERTETRPVTTKNRFSELTDESDSEEEIQETPKTQNTQLQSGGGSNKFKLPPIVINKKFENHKALTNDLSKTLTKGFYLKFTNSSTLIFADDESEYRQLLKEMEDTEINHHSYTLRSEKNHAFVLRGLDTDPSLKEIEDALQEEHEIKIKKIFKMKTKVRPLYLLTTDAAITLNWLNRNAKYVLNTRIYWERRKSEKEIIQCHRCQVWGHATSNCRHPYRCLKCAKNHATHTCTKSIDEPAKCANCGADHPANSVQCSVYQERLQRIQSQKSQHSVINKKTFTLNKEHFPVLPATATQTISSVPTVQWPRKQPQITQKTQVIPSRNHGAGRNLGQDFSLMEAVAEQMNILDNKIDLKQVLLALRDLNQRLKSATNNFDVILIMQSFKEDVNQFNFFKNAH